VTRNWFPIPYSVLEKGVEDETFACGTGITASAIASWLSGTEPSEMMEDGRVRYDVYAKRDRLAVDFVPSKTSDEFHDVWLTGPAAYVAEIILQDI
jgi:diaminopimelate epimerase